MAFDLNFHISGRLCRSVVLCKCEVMIVLYQGIRGIDFMLVGIKFRRSVQLYNVHAMT